MSTSTVLAFDRRSLDPARVRAALTAGLLIGIAVIVLAPAARAQQPVEIEVERVRAKHEKQPTLRFLRENRDFLRARIDLLRQKAREARGGASDIDPRYLAYPDMLAHILAARDSVALADRRNREELLASITQLGLLENDLDLADRLLAEQRGRLSVLQRDFTGHQTTAMIVVVSGDPGKAPVAEISINLEGGDRMATPLTAEMVESLRRGGIVQIFHGFVEPREQAIEVGLSGAGWPAADAGFVRIDPPRDRLTFLRLDLSHLDPERGASSLRASGWLNDTKPQAVRD